MVPTDDATKRLYRDEAHAINARDVRFDFDSVPRLWQFWRATRRGVIPSWTVFFTELPRVSAARIPPVSARVVGHRAAIPGAFPGGTGGGPVTASAAASACAGSRAIATAIDACKRVFVAGPAARLLSPEPLNRSEFGVLVRQLNQHPSIS
ncbi:hypothetical protein [Nocardia araoensis]|uniref:hypothetical protein n=1 Tax=Nocardia araoensis TaxID=228600 RepID=UPI0002EC3D85